MFPKDPQVLPFKANSAKTCSFLYLFVAAKCFRPMGFKGNFFINGNDPSAVPRVTLEHNQLPKDELDTNLSSLQIYVSNLGRTAWKLEPGILGRRFELAPCFRSRLGRHISDIYWALGMNKEILSYDIFPNISFMERARKFVLNSRCVKEAERRERHLWRVQKGNKRESSPRTAEQILQQMASQAHENYIRFLGWFLTYIWRALFSKIVVDETRIAEIQQAARYNSICFVPAHRSHLDYLLMSYVCFAYSLPIPHIAAGDNLSLPGIGKILRSSGAFFIKRSFRDDDLYTTVFRAYIEGLVQEKICTAFFVEGGRSRTGAFRRPKMGVLGVLVDMILRTFQEESPPDATTGIPANEKNQDLQLIPMIFTYDKIIEASSLVEELLGVPKKDESWTSLMTSLVKLTQNFGLNLNCFSNPCMCDIASLYISCATCYVFIYFLQGCVRVNFGKAISVRQHVTFRLRRMMPLRADEAPLGKLSVETKREIVHTLACRLMEELNDMIGIPRTSLVACLLLMVHRSPWFTITRLQKEFDWYAVRQAQ